MLQGPIARRSHSEHAMTGRSRRSVWGRLLNSNRFLLSALLLIAIVLPELVHPAVDDMGRWFEADAGGIEISLFASIAALVTCHFSLRQMGNLPLVTGRLLIPPTFVATYSVIIVAFYAIKVPLAPYHFWTSALIGVLAYSALAIARARYFQPLVALIGLPGHFTHALPGNIRWLPLDRPALPCPVSAIVVDPHAELDLECSHFLTDAVLQGVPVYHRSHLEEGLTGRVRFRHYADNNFGALLPSLNYLRIKRLLDLVLVVLFAPFVIAILAVAAVLIRIDSRGPAIYTQLRRGFRGTPFVCYKLRTMRNDHGGPAYTSSEDDRVTRIGRFLRKWRIDELPQVLNIIRGEMSWIGPRPEAIELAAMYGAQVPFYDYRHAVRPGISGWAAVHQGNVALVEAARTKLEYDFYYIKYFSFWLDCLIALKTAQTVVTGFGSR